MPRTRRRSSGPVIPTTALVASSTRYPGKAARIYQPSQNWQIECYRHYSICGEARFAAKFFGHAVSRAVLKPALLRPEGPVVQTSGAAFGYLGALFNGKDGQTQMLEAIATHLTIAGECYLVGRQDSNNNDVWEIVSCLEMKVTGGTWTINYGEGVLPVTLSEQDVVIRIWIPSPARRMEADSPFRSLLPILSEIEYLTRHIFAQVSSRLAGAGILFLPQGMSFPPPPDNPDGTAPETQNDAEQFMSLLAEVMMTPLKDPGSPAAMVPIVVQAEEKAITATKLMHFWSELDAAAKDLRNEALRRFALGMDLPPEQILGLSSRTGTGGGAGSSVSHWGAWQIEEATIKLHVEPMLDSIVNALTMGYLRPSLNETAGSTALIIYDTSALRLRPDRSKEAFEMYDRGLLKPEALARENGVNIEDLSDDADRKNWLLLKVATGSATPEQVAAALASLGVDLGTPTPTVPPGNEAPSPPSLLDHPVRPATPDQAATLHACDALVYRALERVGNRLRNNGSRPPGVPAYETHRYVAANGSTTRLLEDAWSCAPQVLDGIADPETIVPVLNSYVESLLTEKTQHTRERLADWLALARI